MATLEKLIKSLENLKLLQLSPQISDESSARKKEKVALCVSIADVMCSSGVKGTPNFSHLLSITMEMFLQLCNDPHSDVRMIADESLNRIIRAMLDNNVVKIQVELHKEIKKNGSARTLRAALWRFAELCHMIRPQKGKPYVLNLIPCILHIAQRTEEPVLETLAVAMPKIFAALGNFTSDNDVKSLLKVFLVNLSSPAAVVRRTAATSILAVCVHCRKPHVFIAYILNTLLDCVVPIRDTQPVWTVLGVLGCLRHLLPHFGTTKPGEEELKGSFGVRKRHQEAPQAVDRLIQVYELCLHYTNHPDHNVVNAALETLHQLLQAPPGALVPVLLSPQGITRSRVHATDGGDQLSRRSLSQMSVAPSLAPGDIGSLLDPETDPDLTSVERWVNESKPGVIFSSSLSLLPPVVPERVGAGPLEGPGDEDEDESCVSQVDEGPQYSNIRIGQIREQEESLLDSPGRPPLSSVQSFQQSEDTKLSPDDEQTTYSVPLSPTFTQTSVPFSACDVGSFTDADVSLKFCSRHLAAMFLLTGCPGHTMPDRNIRVSVKALALNCLASILRLTPDVFLLPLDKNKTPNTEGVQLLSDTLLYSQHSDPQLRALVSTLISSVLKSALIQSGRDLSRWLGDTNLVLLGNFLELLLKGLKDESSVCCGQTLAAVGACLPDLLECVDNRQWLPILGALLDMVANPYWLVKRPNIISLPAPFNVGLTGTYVASLDAALSRVVNLLSQQLLMSQSRHLVFGCCETLTLLSVGVPDNSVPPSLELSAGTKKEQPISKGTCQCFSRITGDHSFFADFSPVSVDLSCQQWLLHLAGNMFSGLAWNSLRTVEILSPPSQVDPHKELWAMFQDRQLSVLSEHLLGHVLRLLSIFVHVLEDAHPILPSTKIPVPPSLSPIKRKGRMDITETRGMSPVKIGLDKEDKMEEKKSGRGVPLGLFANLPHYVKIHDMVKSAYTNYKITLDCGASEKFISLLRTTLEALSQLLEIASLHEAGRVAEEILAYMRLTISIEPTSTVKCVQQLLKSLFGTNLSARWEEEPEKRPHVGLNSAGGFYNTCLQVPYKHLTDYVSSANSTLDHISPWLNYFYNKGERKASTVFKSVNRGADKTALASYIRLFEPMVIKALKQYTVTSDVQLQCRVLLLLIQLVQLRVNYCLLDSDQIFIGFVLKQFEFIEEGQIPQPEELVPRIFYFLVHLSYEKHHSKCIIGVPKVIQLCDELMASGQPPVSHCIQALVPVVEDVFLVRGTTGSTADLKDLDTQREFLVSMLLRLVEYHQVLELLGLVLSESRQGCDWEERWRRWSRQVMDTLLPLLAKGRVRLESRVAQLALHRLLAAASPCVLRPVDPLLKVLLSDPLHLHSSLVGVQRWLGMVLAVLSVLVAQGKEEVVLARLEELGLSVPSPEIIYQKESRDPLNATQSSARLPPDQVLARMLLRVLGVVSSELHTCVLNPVSSEDWNYLHEQFSVFLLYCIHMFQSGSYCRVANATMLMIQSEDPESLPMADVNTLFLELSTRCPLITFLWCYLLTLLNYSNQGFWAQVLRTQPHQLLLNQRSPKSSQLSPCINLEVVRKGGTILYCDYVCENLNDAEQLSWLLVNHTEEIVALSTEPPVQELIAAVHRNSAASGLLVQAVGSKCQDLKQPSFVCRLLRCLEGVHPSQSGALLMLLVPRLLGSPQLAPARQAGALACRRAELLLTLSEEEVHFQLTRADLDKVLESLHGSGLANKHSGLLILLHKLGNQFFNMAAADADKGRAFSPASVRSIQVNKAWFLAHVRHRCCQREYSGLESAQMLSKLDYDDILSVLSCKDFNPGILQDCFKLATQLTLQEYQKAPMYHSDTPGFIPAEETLSRLESPLYRASRLSLLQHVANIRALLPVPHQVYCPVGRQASAKELKYSHELEQLLMDSTLWDLVFLVAPAVTTYLHSLARLGGPCLGQEARDDLAKFAVLCLEAVLWLVSPARLATSEAPQPSHLQAGLCCANAVLKEPNLSAEVGHGSRILSACGAVYRLVQFLLPGDQLPSLSETGLSDALNSPDTAGAALACHQMGTLVLWLERTELRMDNIPTFLATPIKSLIVTLSRMPLVNSYVATPPEAWRQGWTVELGGPSRTTVPPLPVEYLQDIDLLYQLIFRVTLLGWTSRQQFEETWMSLLSVLSLNPSENSSPEETALLVQASSLAVQAITALLVQTLLLPVPGDPNTSQLVHQPRDKPLPISSFSGKLRIIHKLLFWRLQDQELLSADAGKLDHVFQRGNLERMDAPRRYGYSQVSLEYLWTAIRVLDLKDSSGTAVTGKVKLSVSKACLDREQCLAASGLDLHSCLHFLLDLYSQWTLPQSGTPLRLVKEAITSVLSISDLFTERAQFQWMLETFLELSRSHPSEDEILHQYLVLGCCKAASVLGEPEVHERIKKLVEGGLKSAFLPSRIAALHGLLYLLQGGTLLGSEHMLQILPLAIEYIQRHIDTRAGVSEEHQITMWGLAFYLLENLEEQTTETELAPAVLQYTLSPVMTQGPPSRLRLALLQGLERLVVSRSVGGKVREQVTKVAVEQLHQPNPRVFLPALQLLLSCMYTGKCESVESSGEEGKETNPELLIQAMEKTSALFDRIKKGYPFEVELVCGVLPNLLTDFFPPSEILTRVIGEFLSTQQPHPRLMAAVVFQVFERACQLSQLGLLQHWVVLSLANFTQCMPVGMATWCLTCFFISASTNPWLRAIFPHVQSRIGRCDYEDRRLLCVAALVFYNQLTDETQKQTFVSTFQSSTHQSQHLLADLRACL